jgi:aminoglycoside phosphotransferase (APT) family kinase protein
MKQLLETNNATLGKINFAALRRWLTRVLAADQEVGLSAVKIPATGYSAQTVLFDVESIKAGVVEQRSLVLRLEKIGQHVFLDTDIGRQGQMMMALARAGVPVPVVLGIETDAAVLGGQFLVMERAEGSSLPQNPNYHVAGLLTELEPVRRRLLWEEAVSTIARINRLPWRNGFEFLSKPQFGEPGLAQYLAWLDAWRNEAMNGEANAVIDTAIATLIAEQPVNAPVDVLWGDSNPGNFLFSDDGRVAAVLDFEAAALGPAEIDLAWWFFMDEMFSAGHQRQAGLPDRAEQIALYEAALGRPVSNLNYYEILAAVRICLVLARSTQLLIKAGRLPPTNKTAHRNPALQLLANKLAIRFDAAGDDFNAFLVAMNER